MTIRQGIVGNFPLKRAALTLLVATASLCLRPASAADTPVMKSAQPQELPLPVQILSTEDAVVLRNPGKDSAQIVWPENAPDSHVTITRVTMQPGALSERHSHPRSEQIWIVERGRATLLLSDGKTKEVKQGDVIRTPPGATHGVENTTDGIFIYLTMTTPPENMSGFYSERVGTR
ncbi:hypothetical protein OPKNFCMD_4925 [Methylobacterium crusticola]|uniref:Cupin type-1 domain-containing protein n=1 Tax=Methylobacterium crusticola TaxID=1697972 RepID=A0ABQ4R3A9_9HYPH|nr:cupin domain-containing protein [Methylobacterium crusticola]GJD52163.1 hypothetical protein OPKNFCMD_4925 [Methylobacterium crusticola]